MGEGRTTEGICQSKCYYMSTEPCLLLHVKKVDFGFWATNQWEEDGERICAVKAHFYLRRMKPSKDIIKCTVLERKREKKRKMWTNDNNQQKGPAGRITANKRGEKKRKMYT